MFKSAIFYRIPKNWEMPSVAVLEEALGTAQFAPCGSTQTESHGWVEPRGQKYGALVEKVGDHFIFALRSETRAVPASAVKKLLEVRLAELLDQTGRKAGKKEKKEMMEEITIELLPRAFTKDATTLIWLDPQNKLLVVGSGSVAKADKVVTAVIDTFKVADNSLNLSIVQTNTSPSLAMSGWLANQEAPYNFTTDRECELKAPDESKSTVKYARHSLEIDEVVDHIKNGKFATQLAMTWNSRVSFVLTDTMLIKKIEFLDVVLEGVVKGKGEEDNFDADVTIATGELSQLIPDLLEALDGEIVNDENVAPAQPKEVDEPVDANGELVEA